MNNHRFGAVIYSKDPKRISAFYEQVAGLSVCHSDEEYVMLESGPYQLVLLQIPDRLSKTITIESPPVHRENAAIKPVFFVEDIALARELAVKLGGTLNGTKREWSFDGLTVCDGSDPEGNVYQLRCSKQKAKNG